MRQTITTVSAAAALCVAALTVCAPAAHAQTLFLTQGDYFATDETYRRGTIHVGLDGTFSQTNAMGVPYTAGLVITTGAVVENARGYNSNTINMDAGRVDNAGVSSTARLNLIGGSIASMTGNNNTALSIGGGTVQSVTVSNNATLNISGGTTSFANGLGTSRMSISGGFVQNVILSNSANVDISGGTVFNGVMLNSATATANIVGTGLSFAYIGYSNSNPYGVYADLFRISGTFGGGGNRLGDGTAYDVYIRNPANASGTPNAAPRQFSFNGAPPVVVPESGTVALLLPALGVVGVLAARRRK